MSVRVCMIGNSHLAALKLGWDRISAEYPDYEITWFGSTGNEAMQLILDEDNLIRPPPGSDKLLAMMRRTSRGLGYIDPTRYDWFVITGLSTSPNKAMSYFKKFRLAASTGDDSRELIGEDRYRKIVFAGMRKGMLVKTVGLIRTVVPGARITLIPDPYVSRAILGDADAGDWLNEDIRRLAFSTYSDAVEKVFRPLVEVVTQPGSTVVDTMFTKLEFSAGALKVSGDSYAPLAKGDADRFHMNADYGVIRLTEVFGAKAA